MNKEQKVLLESYAKILVEIDQRVVALSDDELKVLLAACDATSETNCWYQTYRAANLIRPMIRDEIYFRSRAKPT